MLKFSEWLECLRGLILGLFLLNIFLENLFFILDDIDHADFTDNTTPDINSLIRSNHQEVFCKKDVLKKFAKSTGKHLCQSPFLNKVAGATYNFIKIDTLAQVFPCEFCEFFKNIFFAEHLLVIAFKNSLF